MAAKKRARPSANASTIDVPLTRDDLEFLRDTFGIVTPVVETDGNVVEKSISVMLGEVTRREQIEDSLWEKISRACEAFNLPVGDVAPSYAVSAANVPTMHLYKLEE